MSVFSFLGVLSSAHINFSTFFGRFRKIGEDGAGNRYYTAKPRPGYKNERRRVIYKGEPEASKVPPEWHGWLHHQSDEIPSEKGSFRQSWQKPHQQNMTGTKSAYRPPGHILEGNNRDKASGDYESWTPPK